MEHLPAYTYIIFCATVLLALWLFFKAANFSKYFIIPIVSWLLIQSALGVPGFYRDPVTMSGRFPLLFMPALVAIIILFVTKRGRDCIDLLDVRSLTIFHVIRIPVEMVLFWLYVNKSVPGAMTFNGSNFDIFSGISAPLVYYLGFVKKKIGGRVIIAWNFICLALLLHVVLTAVLSLPARFQQFGFERPDIALGYFPFVWLPSILVPLVLLSHLAAIKQLLKKRHH